MGTAYICRAMKTFRLAYETAISLYETALWVGAAFSGKIRKMQSGRLNTLARLRKFRESQPQTRIIWFHAASVGEFEQALPIIRSWKARFPDFGVAVSFYSPSGFELKSAHPLVDIAFYLPADRRWKAAQIIKILRPEALVLVKYEFWYNLLATAHRFQVPVVSVCCILKPDALSRWPYAKLLKACFPLITHFFVQNTTTAQVLREANIRNLTINGDTRVDRVLELKHDALEIPWLETWKGDHKLLIVGSAWAEDLIYLRDFIRHAVVEAHGLWRVLVVPHEIESNQLRHLISALQLPFELYTTWKEDQPETDILVLDTLGLLSRSYRYADAAWVGGAFKTGLHNTLEPAVYGIPVGFGPRFEKFQEARDLLSLGLARSFPEGGSVWAFFQEATEGEEAREKWRSNAQLYFERQKGASETIVRFLEELLISPETLPS
jgi:3-deoxy-D-manno-octulosonic-acid transferase